ncbi:MAG TPA: MBOAT family O-acyltransferase [Chryseolinea sp.]|nr:MBOAT family O-acyltransferase [Chryseolinea sp.]
MVFNSYTFIAFFIIMLVLHNLPFPWKVKKVNLLLASYIFYAAWNPPFIILLWISTLIDYIVGKKLYETENPLKRKLLLWISLAGNLGMLGYFKYGGFLLENFVSLTSALGIDFHPAKPDIILPVGISFYTFQTLSYTLDMYRKKRPPEKSLLDFSLFVTFLPQLVAGPIVRPDQLIPQFKKPHVASGQQMIQGLFLLSLGLFMKSVLADTLLAAPADQIFGSPQPLLAVDAWLGVLAFSGQIFFDFAGYSTCAIGIANCLGFSLVDNFRYPYAAIGFSDFWRRWHITLSTWLRDYLYIPLGGNRKGTGRTYINLMITMLLGGLWHGASWTFVVWGALHGTYLCVEKLIREKFVSTPKPPEQEQIQVPVIAQASIVPSFGRSNSFNNFLLAMFTFFLINVTWVFFRAKDFTTAWQLLTSMFGQADNGIALLPTIDMIKVTTVVTLMVIFHWFMRNTSVMQVAQKMKWWMISIVWSFMLIALIVSQKSSDSFIYFQF